MGAFWKGLGGQILASLFPIIAVGVVGLLIWRKLFGAQTATQVVDNTVKAAGDSVTGLQSIASSLIDGTALTDAGYVSQDEARQMAAAALAKKRAGAAATSGGDNA